MSSEKCGNCESGHLFRVSGHVGGFAQWFCSYECLNDARCAYEAPGASKATSEGTSRLVICKHCRQSLREGSDCECAGTQLQRSKASPTGGSFGFPPAGTQRVYGCAPHHHGPPGLTSIAALDVIDERRSVIAHTDGTSTWRTMVPGVTGAGPIVGALELAKADIIRGAP